VPVLTISANDELVLAEAEDDVELLEPPRLPAVVPDEPPVEDPDDVVALEPLVPDVLPVEPADTLSPGERVASEEIVPLTGA
jgi:hypothetical protein